MKELSALSSFVELGASTRVAAALARRGIEVPFEIQERVLPDAFAGHDVLAKSRTGSGKTLAFGVPIVERIEASSRRPAALILVPTRELAVQVTDELGDIAFARHLSVAPVYGGVPLDEQARRADKAHILVATPGRLWDLMNRNLVSIAHVRILVLDEADRMLDMGFQPQVDRIVSGLRGVRRQTMFFSATLEGLVGHLARVYTTNPARHEIIDARPVIEEAEHRFVAVDEHDKLQGLLAVLKEERGLALVFVRTKRGADRLRTRLAVKGFKSLALHSDMSQGARQRALETFGKGRVDVLVATDVAARGLDLDAITHVINYDPPRDHHDYVHRVGRTARAGRPGAGVTFVTPGQHGEISAIARRLELSDEFQADGMTLAPTRTIFSSRGNRSMMRSRRRPRF